VTTNLEPYGIRTFGNTPSVFVYRRRAGKVSVVTHAMLPYLGTRHFDEAEFDRHYKPIEISKDHVSKLIANWKRVALSMGITCEAAEVLVPKFIKLTKEEYDMSTEEGSVKEAAILDSAQAEHDKDVKTGATTGKAPRKLAGAALLAVQRKAEREAAAKAEAKADKPAKPAKPPRTSTKVMKLAEEVSEELKAEGDDGKVDATLAGKAIREPKAKKPVKAKKTEPAEKPAKAAKVEKPAKAPKTKPAADGAFDVSKLKNADGEYKSASSMFKGLLIEGKLTDVKIAEAVDKKFDLGDQKAKDYVKWNRGWFRRQGITIPDAK